MAAATSTVVSHSLTLAQRRKRRPIRRDPAGANAVIVDYERLLLHFMEEYRRGAHAMLNRSRSLATPAYEPLHLDLQALQGGLAALSRMLLQKVRPDVEKSAGRAYGKGVVFAANELAAVGLTAREGFTTVDNRVLKALAARNITALSHITEATNAAIMRTVSDGMMKNDGLDKIADAINANIDGIGVNRARVMARTETMNALNQATLMRYKEQGVDKVVWIAAEDDRTCDDCADLHMRVFAADDVPDQPHPNCRCTTAPYVGPDEPDE